ncbi:hypothetical protein [Solicola sp. PLA-1-18]|uniref:hypothetical protein n=1 Tax=Solicola sp. PLA-1-18 TaxID=3380532 RepID=UPI003B7A95C1
MTTTEPHASAAAPCRGPVRVLRSALPAVAAVLVAVGGHVAGGGATPSPVVLASVSVGAGVLAALLAGRRWTPRTVVALLLALQGVVHLTCSMTAAPASAVDGGAAAMLAWHLVATVVTTAALCWGESVLWSLVEVLGLRRMGALLQSRARVVPRPRAARADGSAWVALGHARDAGLRLRGPPAAAC